VVGIGRIGGVAEFNAEAAGEAEDVGADGVVIADDLFEGDEGEAGFMEGDHHAAFAGAQAEDGEFAHAAGDEAVAEAGAAAALDMAEDGDAEFLFDEGVFGVGAEELAGEVVGTADSFGEDDDAVIEGIAIAQAEELANAVEVRGEFGDDGDFGAGADGGHEGEITGVAAHDFDQEAAAVGAGGVFNFIDELHDGVGGGVEADADVGVGDVVVDGAGKADDADAEFVEFLGASEGAVAADDDEGVDAVGGEDVGGAAAAFFVVKSFAAGGLEDGAAFFEDAAEGAGVEFDVVFIEDALVAVVESEDADVLAMGGFGGGADGGVHSGRIAAGGEDAEGADHGGDGGGGVRGKGSVFV